MMEYQFLWRSAGFVEVKSDSMAWKADWLGCLLSTCSPAPALLMIIGAFELPMPVQASCPKIPKYRTQALC